jgi:hypothetical protein
LVKGRRFVSSGLSFAAAWRGAAALWSAAACCRFAGVRKERHESGGKPPHSRAALPLTQQSQSVPLDIRDILD